MVMISINQLHQKRNENHTPAQKQRKRTDTANTQKDKEKEKCNENHTPAQQVFVNSGVDAWSAAISTTDGQVNKALEFTAKPQPNIGASKSRTEENKQWHA